jgi:hypothetical protein
MVLTVFVILSGRSFGRTGYLYRSLDFHAWISYGTYQDNNDIDIFLKIPTIFLTKKHTKYYLNVNLLKFDNIFI